MSLFASSVDQLISRFQSASLSLERYLLEDRPLSSEQVARIAATVARMQTVLRVWTAKHEEPRSS